MRDRRRERRVVDGRVRVDLPYEEDSRAEVDMNVVATDTGTLVEIQGTGEGATFPRSTLDKMLDAALAACDSLFAVQREALALPYPGYCPTVRRRKGVRQLTTTTRLLVASRNRKKLAESCAGCSTPPASPVWTWSPRRRATFDEAPETGATFEENVVAKARDGYAATGLPTLADDSGLAVAALNGMPGVLGALGGAHGDDTANYARCSRNCATSPTSGGAAFVRHARWCPAPPMRDAGWFAANGRGRSRGRPGRGWFRLRPGLHSGRRDERGRT